MVNERNECNECNTYRVDDYEVICRAVDGVEGSPGQESFDEYRESLDDDYSPEGEYSQCERLTLQHGEGEHSVTVETNMCLDYLFIIALVMRIQQRYKEVCIVSLVEFFDQLDFEEISCEKLESHIQTLFQNDDTDLERLWNELGLEVFLPDREDE